jgi:hypothetical protein
VDRDLERDDGHLSDTADVEDNSSNDGSKSQAQSMNDWDNWSINEDMLSRLQEQEKQGVSPFNQSARGSENPKNMPNLQRSNSMPDLGGDKKKKKKKSKKKSKKRSKSEIVGDIDVGSLISGTDGSASTILSEADSASKSQREKRRSKRREKVGDEPATHPKNEKKKKRKSKVDGTDGSSLSLPGESNSVTQSPSVDSLPSKVRRARSKSRTRSPSRSRRKSKVREGSKKDITKESSKRDITGKKLSSKREITGTKEKKRLKSSIKEDGLGTGLMLPSVPIVEGVSSQEILRLHQLLSDALQKVASQSTEQIQDKDLFLKVSTDLSSVKAEFESVKKERDDLMTKLDEREMKIEKCVDQIDSLAGNLERQRADQVLVETDLQQSEADVDKLLIKIEDLERAGDTSGGAVTDDTLRFELKEAKLSLVDKKREVETQRTKIENLENELDIQKTRIQDIESELEQAATVNKLEVAELVEERKALQGKLKGERLELSSKLSQQDETIASLEQELARFRGNGDFEEIAVVREELEQTRAELKDATKNLEVAQNMLTKVKGEKEDLLERNSKLNAEVKRLEKSVNELTTKSNDLGEKVLKWTEQTYEWKGRAELAEKKLSCLSDGNEVVSDSGSAAEEAPQGLFLQAIMDKQENSKKATGRWSIFSRPGQAGDEDATAEDIRIKGLEEQNHTLLNNNSELQSDFVKMQATHKDEIYTKQKQILQLEGENEALKLKNQAFEEISEK